MIKIVKIKTFDGELHDSTKDAKKYLNGLLGTFIAKHAHALSNRNYKDAGDYLEANLDTFSEALKIKRDLEYTDNEND